MIGAISPLQFGLPIGGNTTTTSSQQGSAAPLASGGMTTSFSQALAQAAEKGVGTMENAEAMSIEALKGNANTREVADAVMNAQQTLQAAVAIRDKIVSAYLDVTRMSI